MESPTPLRLVDGSPDTEIAPLVPGAVSGDAHPAFAPAVSYFSRLFGPRSAGGGALSVRLRGEPVVDVWAGFADRDRTRPWEADMVTICFSTTKGLASTVVHRLADRGLIGYDEPVASFWPEFAAAGKGAITVRRLLSHKAGLHSMVGLVTRPEDLLDHVALEEKLAARRADPWPGHPGYHAFTYGWLLAGLARRVTGSGMAELVRRELAEPLRTDGLGIGRPADGTARFARPLDRTPPIRPTPPAVARLSARSMPALRRVGVTRRFFEALYVPDFDRLFAGDEPAILGTEMPAVNGLLSARGLAALYEPIANDGMAGGARFLSPATVEELGRIQTRARDVVVGLKMNWRLGYHAAGSQGSRGDAVFGHYGYGGSGGWADPTTGLSFGFVTNDLRLIQAPIGGDGRIFRLSGLVLRAARALLSG